jgi:hypothetical protein
MLKIACVKPIAASVLIRLRTLATVS